MSVLDGIRVPYERIAALNKWNSLGEVLITGVLSKGDIDNKDLEGMQTMRTLAGNTAWLLKNAQVGQKNGIRKPQYQPRMATNFIQ